MNLRWIVIGAVLSIFRPVLAEIPSAPARILLGADISTLAQVEQRGGVFRDHGQPDDAIAIFTRHGWNCFRLRIFVDPDGRGGVINSLAYTRPLAKRIKDSGATLILDFHYSDTWADPQHQIKPRAWKDLPFDDLEKQVEQYTADVMRDLKENGASPDIVQIGNEITGGTLWPDAQVQVPDSNVKVFEGEVRKITPPQPYDDAKQWDHLARIVKAGIRGVRSISPSPRTLGEGRGEGLVFTRIMLHIDCGGDWPVTRWYFDHMTEHGVEFDLIGQSYYPHWHGTLDNVRETLRETAARYHKDIVIVETAYPRANADRWASRKNMAWPVSAEGQKKFLSDLMKAVRETPDGHGVGIIYWHPESVPTRGSATRPWNGGAMSLFDDEGNALPSLDPTS